MTKKSDHKHEYELLEIPEESWFTHKLVCKICGHIGNRLTIYK